MFGQQLILLIAGKVRRTAGKSTAQVANVGVMVTYKIDKLKKWTTSCEHKYDNGHGQCHCRN